MEKRESIGTKFDSETSCENHLFLCASLEQRNICDVVRQF